MLELNCIICLDCASFLIGTFSNDILRFDPIKKKFSLEEGCRLHLYINTAPCGDARYVAHNRYLSTEFNWVGRGVGEG